MTPATVGTHEEWLTARRNLMIREKELTRLRDELAAQRRSLPWVPVETEYAFETETGSRTLAELFDGRSQLAVYHFMFGPDWDAGCPSCSFWLDNLNGIQEHLAHRDVTFVAVSRAPLASLLPYRDRMGWTVPWVSSAPSTFNVDFGVSFAPGATGVTYNFTTVDHPEEELPGFSAFAMDGGRVFHTYSAYSRGIDAINGAYQVLDLMPKGRDEDVLDYPAQWLRRHDEYESDGRTVA